jgi:hypothetical protein
MPFLRVQVLAILAALATMITPKILEVLSIPTLIMYCWAACGQSGHRQVQPPCRDEGQAFINTPRIWAQAPTCSLVILTQLMLGLGQLVTWVMAACTPRLPICSGMLPVCHLQQLLLWGSPP